MAARMFSLRLQAYSYRPSRPIRLRHSIAELVRYPTKRYGRTRRASLYTLSVVQYGTSLLSLLV
jgi:hypothetical protein